VIAEGRVATPAQAAEALAAGASSVVVGTANTAPMALTRLFGEALAR
jgi:N-acylglucosamine-6-phosphate 2-epimerase